jgi:hypothetical protein
MSYSATKAQIVSLLTGIVPDTDSSRRFYELQGKQGTEDAAPNSGAFRAFS